jgi:hypothetical protein
VEESKGCGEEFALISRASPTCLPLAGLTYCSVAARMSFSTKALFAFLTVFSLLTVILGYEGIAKMERCHYPPFLQNGFFHVIGGIEPPPDKVVLALYSSLGRMGVWFLTVALPLLSGLLAFRHERRILGFSILMLWTALCCWIGIRLWLHAVLDVSPYE